ncbi:hypothetical protein LTR66_004071 [Elasticomyces elasticus]|nr:hypothetical protein LTR66_004071 [Elasticomyces elasticus]
MASAVTTCGSNPYDLLQESNAVLHKPTASCVVCTEDADKKIGDQDVCSHQERQTLQIGDFAECFDRDFLSQYRRKELEYLCAITERVYCSNPRCSIFHGPKDHLQHFDARKKRLRTEANKFWRCRDCKTRTCLTCSKAFKDSPSQPHACSVVQDRTEDYKGLKRGKHFQVCPNTSCAVVIQLQDGCNHMTCAQCQTSFCYICGKHAQDGSAHWLFDPTAGVVGCPRYGRPNHRNAIYDSYHGDDDDDEEEDDSHDSHDYGSHWDGDSDDDEQDEEGYHYEIIHVSDVVYIFGVPVGLHYELVMNDAWI